jgi:HK97 family phage major capsid protein
VALLFNARTARQHAGLRDTQAAYDHARDQYCGFLLRNRDGELSAAEQLECKRLSGEYADCYDALRDELRIYGLAPHTPKLGEFLGLHPAGETVLARDGRSQRVFTETGESGLDERTWSLISTDEYRQEMERYLRHGHQHGLQFRNLEVGLDPQGGYLAPAQSITTLAEKRPTPSSLRDLVTTVNTSKDAVFMPRVNYTTNTTDDPNGYIYSTGIRATLTDENPTSGTEADINDTNMFGSVRISIYTWMFRALITFAMREDPEFSVLDWLTSKFDETSRVVEDYYAILGNGAGCPRGLAGSPGGTDTLASVPTVASGNANAPYLTSDAITTLAESIPGQYDQEIRYLYDKTTTGVTVRTLKDANGRPLFYRKLGPNGRTMPGLNGYPVIYSGWAPSPGSTGVNQYPMFAGDFSGITLVRRVYLTFQVLKETYARQNAYEIIGRMRMGVQCTHPWKLRVLAVGAAGSGSTGY